MQSSRKGHAKKQSNRKLRQLHFSSLHCCPCWSIGLSGQCRNAQFQRNQFSGLFSSTLTHALECQLVLLTCPVNIGLLKLLALWGSGSKSDGAPAIRSVTQAPSLAEAIDRVERKALGENCKNIDHIWILTKRTVRSECAGLHRNIQQRTDHLYNPLYINIYIYINILIYIYIYII